MADPIVPDDVNTDATIPATGPDPDGALFFRLMGYAKTAADHLSEWRKEADESYNFYNGYQWSDQALEQFRVEERTAPVFNLVGINVDAIAGLEVNNRQDVKFLPRTFGDVKVNELLSSAAAWVRDQAKADREESDAFTDAVITGIGVTETGKQSEDQITIDRRDPREMFWDKNAKKRNLSDRRFSGRICMMDRDEAQAMFPGVPLAELNARWASNNLPTGTLSTQEKRDYDRESRRSSSPDGGLPKQVCLVEIEWYDFEGGLRVYKQAYLGNTTVLEVNLIQQWAYNFITGKRDEKKKSWYGIVRVLMDPQRILNKFLATVIHILATNAKGGYFYERGVFTNAAEAEKDMANPQKMVEVAEGALVKGQIKERTAPPLPQGAVMLIEFTMNNFSRVSGINVELLGAADRDQPASLEMQRRQSAVSTQASLFDSKRFYHEEQGKTLLALMKTLPGETLARITVDPTDHAQMEALKPQPPMLPQDAPPEAQQKALQQYQQQLQAYAESLQQQDQEKKREMFVTMATITQAFRDDTIKFDVIVDEAPQSPNQQQEILGKLAILNQNGVALPPDAQAIIIENIGLPSTIADTLSKAMAGNNPQLKEAQAQLQQGAQRLQQVEQENAQLKADRSIEKQNADTNRIKANTEQSRARADIIAKTGGVPVGEQIVPAADVMADLIASNAQLAQNVEQLNQAVSAILQRAMGAPQ